jgi:hypothetical protein
LVAADIPSLSYVTSVSGTSPVVSSGGTTPAISMPAATTSVSGYLTSTDWNTFNGKGSGTVTSVTGTSPVVSSGGATPAISMAAATTSVNGYLTSTDWNTFNGKGSGTVTSVAISGGTTGLTTSGGPITTSGTITLAGTVATTNGGTGLTSFTANGVVYASSTSALATGSALTFDGTNFATTGTATATKLIPTGTSVTGNGMYLPATNSVGISTAGVNAVYINASQNVSIGTSSPATKFHVSQTNTSIGSLFNGTTKAIRFGFNTTESIIEGVDNTGVTSFQTLALGGSDLKFTVSGTTRMTLASTGIVTMNAYGAGAATFSAAGVISSVSDETWKIKDGVPVDTDVMLKKLEPGYWYYNDEKKEIFGKDRQLGFYAQNVNAAIGPEAAPEPEEGKPWGYYDRSVLAVVVMSLQKALDTIESLETRLAALEQK